MCLNLYHVWRASNGNVIYYYTEHWFGRLAGNRYVRASMNAGRADRHGILMLPISACINQYISY